MRVERFQGEGRRVDLERKGCLAQHVRGPRFPQVGLCHLHHLEHGVEGSGLRVEG